MSERAVRWLAEVLGLTDEWLGVRLKLRVEWLRLVKRWIRLLGEELSNLAENRLVSKSPEILVEARVGCLILSVVKYLCAKDALSEHLVLSHLPRVLAREKSRGLLGHLIAVESSDHSKT